MTNKARKSFEAGTFFNRCLGLSFGWDFNSNGFGRSMTPITYAYYPRKLQPLKQIHETHDSELLAIIGFPQTVTQIPLMLASRGGCSHGPQKPLQ